MANHSKCFHCNGTSNGNQKIPKYLLDQYKEEIQKKRLGKSVCRKFPNCESSSSNSQTLPNVAAIRKQAKLKRLEVQRTEREKCLKLLSQQPVPMLQYLVDHATSAPSAISQLPKSSPHRLPLIEMNSRGYSQSNVKGLAEVFHVSERTIRRAHEEFTRNKQTYSDKYPHDVSRDRIDQYREDQARQILASIAAEQSGRDFVLLKVSDSELYRQYLQLLPIGQVPLSKEVFLFILYHEHKVHHATKNDKTCQLCYEREHVDRNKEFGPNQERERQAHSERLEKLDLHYKTNLIQRSEYFRTKDDVMMNPQTAALIVWDFSRLDGSGETGGITMQDLVIHLFKPDSETNSWTSQKYHYLASGLDFKPDHDFVGTSFTQFLDNELLPQVPNLSKLFIWSDGGAAHFRSRFAQSMMYFKNQDEFPDISIEWNMFEANHGWGPADGDAAVIKRSINKDYRSNNIALTKPEDFAAKIESFGDDWRARIVDIAIQTQGKSEMHGISQVHKFEYDFQHDSIRGYLTTADTRPKFTWHPTSDFE